MPVMRNSYRGAGPAERFRPVVTGELAGAPKRKPVLRAVQLVDRDTPILDLIEAFLTKHQMSPTQLGRWFNGDSGLVKRLREGGRMQPLVEDQLRRWLAEWRPDQAPAKGFVLPREAEALRRWVDAWCALTGRTVLGLGRDLGLGKTGHGTFAARLASGRITTATAARIRAKLREDGITGL